jgi:hypothetical protein
LAIDDHLIGRLDIQVAFPDMTMAQALRPRIETLGWDLMPRVLEQVFDAMAPRDTALQLAALDLDLGVVRPDHLEEDALASLRSALSDALAGAILRARAGGDDDHRLIPTATARLEQFEAFLIGGILPLTNSADRFDAVARLRDLAADSPAALVVMLRSHARDRHVLERLFLQAGDAGLAMLLSLLAPADAAIIIALLADIVLVHRRARLPALRALSEPALTQLLWVTTLEFLLRDAGSQFNRRRFLAALITREAARLGLSYEAVLQLLADAASIAAERSPLRSSLPGTLAELLAERRPLGIDAERSADAWPGVEHGGDRREHDIAGIAANPLALERLAAALTPAAFGALVAALDPATAEAVMADFDTLIAFHARAPVLPMATAAFGLRLRALMLAYLAGKGAGPVDRGAMWRMILRELARAGRVDPPDFASAVERRLRRSGSTAAAILLKAIAAGGIDFAHEAVPDAAPADDKGIGPIERAHRLAILLEAGAVGAELMAVAGALPADVFGGLLRRLDPDGGARLLADIDTLVMLHAQAPFFDIAGDALESMVRAILLDHLAYEGRARGHRAAWKAVITQLAARRHIRPAAFAAMVRHRLRRAGRARIDRTEPDNAAGALNADLTRERGRIRPAAIDFAAPAGRGEDGWDRVDSGRPAAVLALVSADAQWRMRIEHFLRTGQPAPRGADLPDLARSDPEWLAGMSRTVAREAPAVATALAERLLEWLLPEEIAAIFAPHDAAEMLRAANREAGGDQAHWRLLLVALLRGETVAPGVGVAVHPGVRLDRVAALSAWLAGASAVVATGRSAAFPSPADLLDLDNAELASLLLADDDEQTLARLASMTAALGAEAGGRLLARLAPWAANADGPLASVHAGGDRIIRGAVMLRAAAAALAGAPIDMAALMEPVPHLPAPSAVAASIKRFAVGAGFEPERLFAWLDGAPATDADAAELARLFARLADEDDPALAAYIAAHRARPRARARWAAILPYPAMGRLVHLLVPNEARVLLDGVMLLTTAWRQLAPFGARRPAPEALWAMLLDQVAEPRRISVPAVLDALVTRLAGDDAGQAAKVRERARKLAREGGYASVATALRRGAASPPQPRRPAAARPASRDAGGTEHGVKVQEPEHALYVGNAGLVLLHPYLPTLFERLGLLVTGDDDRPVIPPGDPASRAVHLLQYLADGRLDRPEPELVLNKLLCGQPTFQPVARSIAPTQADLEICDDLLRAVIANWPILADTSPAALQETFLQREGRLRHGDGKWTLQVQRKTLDVLVDQVPWSFAVVYHRWMTDPIYVTW